MGIRAYGIKPRMSGMLTETRPAHDVNLITLWKSRLSEYSVDTRPVPYIDRRTQWKARLSGLITRWITRSPICCTRRKPRLCIKVTTLLESHAMNDSRPFGAQQSFRMHLAAALM
ncbi:hypothetical protein DPMN_168944 [Dreissena polymorpha]|uniref:Uncharacterized protein n=1 Tax=Dreissena polymorpha TaxID=45954 RepID=A0A9D4F2U8_DREPO|nr:hypothetical protein DPMN_168944 [Dreissena polymorpha]